MRTNEEIVKILISEKDKQGLSISELARRVDMAKSAISRYFNFSREFPLNRANDFARVLGISTEYLLGISKDEVNKKEPSKSGRKINTIFDKLEEPRQEKVIDFAETQLKEQEKVKSIEDYWLTDEFLDKQIKNSVAYGGTMTEKDEKFFKELLKNTLKEKIDKGK